MEIEALTHLSEQFGRIEGIGRKTAMRMMQDIEELTERLPGLDCGSCGAPTCMAFAEDIVKNETSAEECTVLLKRILKGKDIQKEQLYAKLGLPDIASLKSKKEENDDG